ncbi:UNVERIFIED_CONTAM: PHD finger protein MALE STERILITY 1 [Sesamum calycinum]|uniref:PHD finger protein MALE STERILITY 1 n=1 Tax=Sesamum calycinum TaxID=2727403 RepID=A0AAW2QYB5_9LAMI
MSQLDLSGCKKRKRGERVFKFKVFGERGYPAEFNGSTFQENVRALLEYGQVESGVCGAMASWSFQLEVRRHPLLHLFLFVVEEPIELSLELRCKHCQYIGWGHHMICNKKYHFLLPSKSGSAEYCKSNVIELQGEGHSLHGVFHSNGFGHLLCINGSESGSDLPGYQIMEFWDRLLRIRSQESELERCCKEERHGFKVAPCSSIRYQLLSGHSLITVGDLFHFMLELKFRIPKECSSIGSNYPGIMSDASCRWSPKRVEMAIHVVVEALKRAEYRWVSRQHVRDVARAYIGDTGLLDFVLKSLGNHMVGKYFVRRCLNPVTKVLEYCLEDVSRPFPKQEAAFPISEPRLKPQQTISRAQLVKDTFCVYKNILGNHNLITNTRVLGTIPMAARAILDSKHLIKEYYSGETSKNYETNKQTIYCTVILANSGTSAGPDEVSTPYHCFVLRNNAAFDELKCEVEKTFREIYFGLRNFVAESVRNMKFKGSDLVFKTVKPGSKIVFEGKQEGPYGVICEGLMAVDCVCGAKDDDGERMVSCDVCQVWQHTRCVQVPDEDEIPNVFVCSACEKHILSFRSLP